MQHIDAFVLIDRCLLQQNCVSVPDDSPVAICLRSLGVFMRLDRVGVSDGVLKGGSERGWKRAPGGRSCILSE